MDDEYSELRHLAETGTFVLVEPEAIKDGDNFHVMEVYGDHGEVVAKHFYVHVPKGRPN
ncbi:hypothetical protein [uncultured Nitratireductor sp.]|uniref:hypothetical protein n=1 Tax=uncultured Nitratireductor sp. TaxID=520953 RepID=UPI002609F5C3|nr:hypothetical protein [uncultured Nitratireductor sp.]